MAFPTRKQGGARRLKENRPIAFLDYSKIPHEHKYIYNVRANKNLCSICFMKKDTP